MSLSAEAIDRIVVNVLNQISATATGPAAPTSPDLTTTAPAPCQISLPGAVITAEVIEAVAAGSFVTVRPRAIVTPAAWDAIKLRNLRLERGAFSTSSPAAPGAPAVSSKATAALPLLIVVRNNNAVSQLGGQLAGSWKRELQGCPDDAAKLAIGEICRAAVSAVVILTEQPHRAACLANRHEHVKAVAVQTAGDVKIIRTQLRANVWCVNPENRSYFELKNLIQQIENGFRPKVHS